MKLMKIKYLINFNLINSFLVGTTKTYAIMFSFGK